MGVALAMLENWHNDDYIPYNNIKKTIKVVLKTSP